MKFVLIGILFFGATSKAADGSLPAVSPSDVPNLFNQARAGMANQATYYQELLIRARRFNLPNETIKLLRDSLNLANLAVGWIGHYDEFRADRRQSDAERARYEAARITSYLWDFNATTFPRLRAEVERADPPPMRPQCLPTFNPNPGLARGHNGGYIPIQRNRRD